MNKDLSLFEVQDEMSSIPRQHSFIGYIENRRTEYNAMVFILVSGGNASFMYRTDMSLNNAVPGSVGI